LVSINLELLFFIFFAQYLQDYLRAHSLLLNPSIGNSHLTCDNSLYYTFFDSEINNVLWLLTRFIPPPLKESEF